MKNNPLTCVGGWDRDLIKKSHVFRLVSSNYLFLLGSLVWRKTYKLRGRSILLAPLQTARAPTIIQFTEFSLLRRKKFVLPRNSLRVSRGLRLFRRAGNFEIKRMHSIIRRSFHAILLIRFESVFHSHKVNRKSLDARFSHSWNLNNLYAYQFIPMHYYG